MCDEIKAVIGTNSWGSKAYGKVFRGSYVDEAVISEAVATGSRLGLKVFDLARDYGFGKAQKIMGGLAEEDTVISAKYTPFKRYKKNCVRKSLEKDLEDFRRSYVDIYWLHLPIDIKEHLEEIIELYNEGKIRHVGVSNFDLEECILSKKILEKAGIPLYGVQNHYSIISREWEKNGLLEWCSENGVSFWAWAVLEEGLLTDPRKKQKLSVMKPFVNRQKRKLRELYKVMISLGKKYDITVPQVAEAFCASKGIVPISGCRRPSQVSELAQAVGIRFTDDEIRRIEAAADRAGAKLLGPDMFRFYVPKKKVIS